MLNQDNHIIGSFFNNGIFAEFNGCPIYEDLKVIGKEYWSIQLIFFRGMNFPVHFCLRLYKGEYQGQGLLDSNRTVTRINMTEPSYIILSDIHYSLRKDEIHRFNDIISKNWDRIINILNDEKDCYTKSDEVINLSIPDYNLLPINE